jgi:Holliday junction resolvasome RuvABC ATP-dependent DNA helicase subunit
MQLLKRYTTGGRAEPAPHMVLVGNPGCGKSMLARLVAYIVSECDVSRHGGAVQVDIDRVRRSLLTLS